MEKTIRLFDYKDRPKEITIKDFENVEEFIFEIVSGDGRLTVVYQDGKTRVLDSSDCRVQDFKDGMWVLEPKNIDVINDMKDNDDIDKLDDVELGYE